MQDHRMHRRRDRHQQTVPRRGVCKKENQLAVGLKNKSVTKMACKFYMG